MKLTLGEKTFVGIPACVILIIVVDAVSIWTMNDWLYVANDTLGGWFMYTVWDNRHKLRSMSRGHTD